MKKYTFLILAVVLKSSFVCHAMKSVSTQLPDYKAIDRRRERMDCKRVRMPEQDALERTLHNLELDHFARVTGVTERLARREGPPLALAALLESHVKRYYRILLRRNKQDRDQQLQSYSYELLLEKKPQLYAQLFSTLPKALRTPSALRDLEGRGIIAERYGLPWQHTE